MKLTNVEQEALFYFSINANTTTADHPSKYITNKLSSKGLIERDPEELFKWKLTDDGILVLSQLIGARPC